ncbi:sterol-binding-like protein [Dacryopinax primogenitus]|uniref:Sterol-binding-like protein n=1 Tax=Dacryopinax primogenitus (strain DJM 731) TaxID=1858805 RepID=M5GG25_DACPD|nr:sterol-binding-like protein [Dacryopinax primogenitus]EJU04748.1 sterol-binding-like protein [Dacryopinax primogenitus]
MSDIKEPGFKSSELFARLAEVLEAYTPEEKAKELKKTNGIFEMQIKGASGEVKTWTIDMKKEGKVVKGKPAPKPDVTIIAGDELFLDLAEGRTNGQKAFMTGKLKTKGNMMLATKLDAVLKTAQGELKAKL